MPDDLIVTERLRLLVLERELLQALAEDPARIEEFAVPDGWPDDDGREHIERWRALAESDGGYSRWRARAVVDAAGRFIGHAGFHGQPVRAAEALDDPTFRGSTEPDDSNAVEIGYTILPEHRRRGYAAEAVGGLLAWAAQTGRVDSVIACVRPDNVGSLAVLDRVGGFREVGTCRDGEADEIVFRRDLCT